MVCFTWNLIRIYTVILTNLFEAPVHMRPIDPANSLKGVALVASPNMQDPRFAQTVILMLHHNSQGAMGVVLNRPMSAEQHKELVAAAETEVDEQQLSFHFGGPVAGPVIVLQGVKSLTEAQQGKMFFISKTEELSGLLGNVEDCRFYVGHANWEGGQLEAELRQGLWLISPVSPEMLFGDNELLWAETIRRVGQSFYHEVLGIKQFPEDVSVN